MRRPSLRNLQDLIGAGFWLVAVELEQLRKGQQHIMATLDETLADLATVQALAQTAVDLLASLKPGLTEAQQAQVDALDAGLKDVATKLTDAENPPA